jgi:hypothetical protein
MLRNGIAEDIYAPVGFQRVADAPREDLAAIDTNNGG